MSFKFTRKGKSSINDNAVRDLPIGSHNYEILKVEIVPVKADKTGKRKHISLQLRHTNGQTYTTFIELNARNLGPKATAKAKDAEEVRVRIAEETFVALMDACGFGEEFTMTAAKLKLFSGKEVMIRTDETKNGDKSYINIREILEADEDLDEEDADDEDEDAEDEDLDEDDDSDEDDDDVEDDDEDDDEEDDEEEEEPAPKKKPRRSSTKKKAPRRTKAKAKPADEEEDDEEEDEDDDPF